MELNSHLNCKLILEKIYEAKEEICATMKEFTTELRIRISPLNLKIDSQTTSDYSIKQTIQEEDLTENKEKLSLPDKQFTYGFEDQEKQRLRFEMSKQRNFMVKRNRGPMQRPRWFTWIQMILQATKRDLLVGREALLWKPTWQKKKPRIRLKRSEI